MKSSDKNVSGNSNALAGNQTQLSRDIRDLPMSDPPTPKMRCEALGAPASRRRDAGAPRQERGNTHSSSEFSCSVAPYHCIGTYVGCYDFSSALSALISHVSIDRLTLRRTAAVREAPATACRERA